MSAQGSSTQGSSTHGTPSIPAGWYPDPQNPAQQRFWNGVAWTDDYHQPGQPYPPMPELKAPPGTDWNTPWIWLIVVIPLAPSLLLLLVPWGAMWDIDPRDPVAASTMGLSLFLSPAYWLAVVLGWVVYGLTVFFAYRDVRELTARGVPRPFHWAFAFIGGVVYAIGRSVVVHRRTGNGHQPIWAEVGVLLVSIGIMIAVMVMLFSGMNDFILRTVTG